MAHTNYGELRQLFETFTRVWEAGGQTSLHLHTQDGKARATLDIQLGPPADPRPGAPDVRGEGPGPVHGPQHHLQPHQRRPRRRGPAARARDEVRREAWLQEQGKIQQPRTADSRIGPEVLITTEVDDVKAKNLDSSEASPTDMIVDDIAATNLDSSEASKADILGFLCEQCGYSSASDKGMKQHVRMEHRIAQVDGVDDIDSETDIKSKEIPNNRNTAENERKYYKVELDSKGHHAGQGTPQLCEFLEEPPAQLIHPEYGKGVFKEIDKDWGTFIYKFEGVTAEV